MRFGPREQMEGGVQECARGIAGASVFTERVERGRTGIVLRQPMSGQYDIWVGNYDRGRGIPTQVFFSDVPPT